MNYVSDHNIILKINEKYKTVNRYVNTHNTILKINENNSQINNIKNISKINIEMINLLFIKNKIIMLYNESVANKNID